MTKFLSKLQYIQKSFLLFNIFCESNAPPDKSEPRLPHWQPTIDSARKAQWFVKWSFRRAMYNFYNFYNFWVFSNLRKIFRFLGSFQSFEKFCDLRHDTWDTDYISDNWEQQYGQLHCDLWIESDGDSIRNSCDVSVKNADFTPNHKGFLGKMSL